MVGQKGYNSCLVQHPCSEDCALKTPESVQRNPKSIILKQMADQGCLIQARMLAASRDFAQTAVPAHFTMCTIR